MDKALKQQIVKAVEPTYLTPIRDRTTNTINMTVYEVTGHLFTTYGDIDPNNLNSRESTVKAMIYDPKTPINK